MHPHTDFHSTSHAPFKVRHAIGNTPKVLDRILDIDVNIAIQERDECLSSLVEEIADLADQGVSIRASGDLATVIQELREKLGADQYPKLIDDFSAVISRFMAITQTAQVRVLLATIDNDMCRRFHVDINNVRLLCTYQGPGTQWLTEENIDFAALQSTDSSRAIALDDGAIKHAKTGALVLLKGAMYPDVDTNACVHRSPSISAQGRRRLLLRVDTNETMNLWN